MSFEDDWAQAKASAADRQSTSMQLNQLPGGHGPRGPGDTMKHSEAEAKGAASYIEETLGPDVKKAGAKADGDSAAITGRTGKPGGLNDWETKAGMQSCLTEWDRQLQNLTNRLAAEAAALRSASKTIHGNDSATGSDLGSLLLPGSKLNGY